MSDLATDILQDFGESLTVTRTDPGAYASGEYIPGATSTFTILMTLQPLTDSEMLSLPEGRRDRRMVKGYTDSLLRVADQGTKIGADKILFEGVMFEVERVERWRWDQAQCNFWKVLLAAVNP